MLFTPPLWLAGALVVSSIAFVLNRRDQAARLQALRADWGCARDRKRDIEAIAAYHRARTSNEPTGESLDDRTWDDLNLDDVFSVLDRTESVVGQQALYARLRATHRREDLASFEALTAQMSDDAPMRETARLALAQLRAPAGYDLWWLTQPESLEIVGWHILFPLMGIAMLGAAALAPFWPPALFALFIGAAAGFGTRATVGKHLRVVTGAFRQVRPLIAAAEALGTINGAADLPIIGTLREDASHLSRLRVIASLAGRDSTGAISGNTVALVFEYLYLMFWLDANALFFGARELRAKALVLQRVIAAVGDADAAVSVASYRVSTPGWTRPVFQSDGAAMRLRDVRHPLLPEAVPNTIALAPPHGVIITGSNMSGKTTFLRTVGVTAVLAQTINTCLASQYVAPRFRVRSCIGRADDPSTGKSYYLVEVESVLALVHAAGTAVPHLMLFDELFRGTNAVERIAAGEAVLRTLLARRAGGAGAPHVVLAATHDQELVDLLAGIYAAHHFTDAIGDAGLVFDFRLQPGPATTRNAIALLAQRGAPPELVSHALARAETLDRARSGTPIARRPPVAVV